MSSTFSPRTVVQAIEEAAKSTQTGYRFLSEEQSAEPFFSHAGIERASARFGGALQSLGLKKGDRVALILPDNADFVFAFLGALRAGVIPVPIYPPTGLGKLAGYLDNTLHIVDKSGARVLVTTAEIRRLLGTVQSKAPELERVCDVETLKAQREELTPVKVELDDVCFLQFTSGSTSRPKGVVLTHRNIAENVHVIMDLGLKVQSFDVGVSWLPLYHDMGLIGFVLAPLYHVNSITFLPALMFLKRPIRWLEQMSRQKGTISFGPNFAYALCNKRIKDSELEGLDLSSWRVAGCGAEPIRAENLRGFAERFAKAGFSEKAFVSCYGMAESTLAISFSGLGKGLVVDEVDGDALWSKGKAEGVAHGAERAAPVVNCGPSFPRHEIAVFAETDSESREPLPERTVGEIRLRGPSLMRGYWNDADLTREAFAGGWLKTGDIGYLAEGNVHICGRSKEVIIVNGRNYYPQDLEWEASRVEGVRKGNVIAFGTMKPTHDRERVILVLETSIPDGEQREALKGEVRRSVQQALGLTADDVVPVDAGVLPKTSSGKLQRAKTRELYENGELLSRTSIRRADKVEVVKEVVKSQIGYFRHALLGSRKD
ncbi:MAG: fatty acyl-AMP ligase [Polyangiaceae bacterium]|jgi:fatty-acyl-CoA synthase|nr:fatty acyl-AMP ligase [Polyangiaceae bacterium]